MSLCAEKNDLANSQKYNIVQLAANPVCAPYRLEWPGQFLAQGETFNVITCRRLDGEILEYLLNQADMFILQRMPMSARLSKLFNALSRTEVVVVFEIDDDLFHLEPNSRFAKAAPNNLSTRLEQTILSCHAVQCSTQRLATVISDFHPEVAVLGNHLERVPPFTKKELGGRPLIIGYAAGEDHGLDWLTIRDTHNQVVAELEQAGFRMETWIIGDRAIFDSIPSGNKKYFPFLNRQKYQDALSCFDISLMPLADNPFNHCKSDIKFVESAASSCAVIASDIVYGDSIVHGETGLLFKNSMEFKACLKRLLEYPEQIGQMARCAHKYVNEHRLLSRRIHKWEQTYLGWLRKKGQLLRNVPSVSVQSGCHKTVSI